jgi:membrane-bound lytic murein transglycosylase D
MTRPIQLLGVCLLFSGCQWLPLSPHAPETEAPQAQAQTQAKTQDTTSVPRIAPDYQANYTVLGDADFPAHHEHVNLAQVDALNKTTTEQQLEDQVKPIHETFPLRYTNIWNRIRDGFALKERDHPRIDQQLDWFRRHQGYLDRVAERAEPYMHYIVDTLEANDIPTELALLPIVESAFQPFAYSHGRAAGIWQFIPSTGRLYGLKQDWWYDGRRDVYAATRAAVKLLTNLHDRFDGDWLLALAAYNSGGGNVSSAIRYNKRRGRPTDFFSLRLPRETRAYVPKLLALKKLVANPSAYGISLKPIDDEPHFKKVDIDSQIDLSLAAKLADMDIEDLYRLNPGFNRWATSPKGPHYLLLPIDKVDKFKTALKEYPAKERVAWVRHRIRSGDTLSTIAERYHTSISVIRRVNHLRGTRIRAGHSLTIPVAKQRLSSYKLSADQRTRAKQNTPHGGRKVVHTVRSGDTLWDLAQQHRVGVRQLARWNNMAPRDPLVPGQKLVIWSRTDSSGLVSAVYTAPPSRSVTRRIGYRVRKGDSLSRISQRFNVSIHQLRRWNDLPKGKYLQPGQRLTLYVDVTRQSGRT